MKTLLNHKFVEYIPEQIEEGVIYISIEFSTVVHKCVCGCGNEVVTPISPTDWELTFNGKSITLFPSIGNWSFKCQSHYFIEKNKVVQCEKWTTGKIEKGRKQDLKNKKGFFKRLFSFTLV